MGRSEHKLKEELEALWIQMTHREQELMRAHEDRMSDQSETFTINIKAIKDQCEKWIDEKEETHKM